MRRDDLDHVRGVLAASLPWLTAAFVRLQGSARPGLSRPGTDGLRFYYDPEWLQSHDSNACAVLAHSTFHCLLGHVYRRGLDALEADMAVALLMDALLPEFCPVHGNELFLQARHRLANLPLNRLGMPIERDDFFSRHREALRDLLALDDHRYWTPEAHVFARAGNGERAGWEALLHKAEKQFRLRRFGRSPGCAQRTYQPQSHPNRAYRDMLMPYLALREELREDPDIFDRNLYAYGLAHYGNMPIVEPNETRETRRIHELAIVIDTSGSCMETLTTRFLDETRAMLSDKNLFGERFNVRVMQCDARLQQDVRITCVQDFEKHIENLTIVGGGGTDFRPAFSRIDRLIQRGAFKRLPAALFFSDGMGLFPKDPPPYDIVFVFYKGRYDDIDLPPWTRKLVLEE